MLAEALWVPSGRYDVTGSGYEPAGDITDSGDGSPGGGPAVTRLLRDVVALQQRRTARTRRALDRAR